MSSWLACLAAKIDRGRKQTLLKRVVTALERLEVRITDASNPDTIPREPPVDLYDRVFNYRGKMDGLFWHLQHSYCVIMEEKDGTKRADAQKAFKAFYEQDEEEFQEDLEWYCLKKQAKWDLAEKQLESEVAVKPEKERKEVDEGELDELDEVDTVEGESASSTPSRSRSLESQAEGASPSSCDDLLAIQMDDKVSSLPACLAHMEEDAIAGWILRWLRTQFKTFPNLLNVWNIPNETCTRHSNMHKTHLISTNKTSKKEIVT